MAVEIIHGEVHRNRGFAIRASHGTLWYRHDRIKVNGKLLEGSIQVRERTFGSKLSRRIDTMTCFKDACVRGHNIVWLIRMNEPQSPDDQRTVEILNAAMT